MGVGGVHHAGPGRLFRLRIPLACILISHFPIEVIKNLQYEHLCGLLS